MSLRDDISCEAIRFIAARAHKNALKAKRNSYTCPEADPGDMANGDPGTPPCWHGEAQSNLDLCDNCQKRQALHRRVKEAQELAALALRRLRTLCNKSTTYKSYLDILTKVS